MIKKIVFPILIVLLAALAATALVRTRPQVETREVVTLAPLARTMTVERQDVRLDVRAQGTVLPRTETTLISQVAGEVTAIPATTTVTAEADLSIAKSAAPETALAGGALTYTVTATNNGPASAPNVEIVEEVRFPKGPSYFAMVRSPQR